jgi:hypothetical protein
MNPRDRDVLDYLMLTTYQKRRQDGEIWKSDGTKMAAATLSEPDGRPFLNSAPHGRELRARHTVELALLPLPTFLLYRLGPFAHALTHGGAVSSDPLERLAMLLRYAAAPLRWEPLNAYHHHFAAASPRSLTICDLYLAVHPSGTGQAAVYRYLPDHHALTKVGTLPPSSEEPGLTLFVVANLMRSATPYGDFSACIGALEGGGVAGQIASIARAVGWSGPAAAREVATDLRATLGLTHWSQTILGQIDLGGCDVAPQLERMEPAIRAISERGMDEEVEAFARMRRFIEGSGAGAFRLGAVPAETAHATPVAAPASDRDDVLQVVRRRSSGLDNDGSPSRAAGFDRATLAGLAVDWRFLMTRCLTGDLGAVPLTISLTVLNGAPGLVGRYVLRRDADEPEWIGAPDPSHLRSFSSRHYWEGVSFVANISCDPWAALASVPHAPFAAIHGAAGACGHALSLAAARRGMFARPVRAYTEFALGHVTPEDEIPVLQLLCGYSRQANLRFDLV